MAEKKEHKLVSADGGEAAKPKAKPQSAPQTVQHNVKPAKENGSAGGLRAGAVILWVLAIVFEVLAALVLFGKINLTFLPMMWQLIVKEDGTVEEILGDKPCKSAACEEEPEAEDEEKPEE